MAADDPQVIRGIDWRTTFPFTLIFRSFRIAIHPSKLVLALLALVLIYGGGRVLDGIWPSSYSAAKGEIDTYEQLQFDRQSRGEPGSFATVRDAQRKEVQSDFDQKLKDLGKPSGSLSDIRFWILEERKKEVQGAEDEYEKSATKDAKAEDARQNRIREAYDLARQRWDHYRDIEGSGLFTTFAQYQFAKLNTMVNSGRYGRWLGDDGVIDNLFDFFIIGPSWAVGYHPVYFTLFAIYFLIVWAVFGGAISRIAAVQVCRDEKISFRQALGFSTAKFLSFISAPVIPLLIVVVVGLIITAGALVFNVPFLGPIVGGLLFVLALAAGFVMTLVLIGLVGGFNLMYPTIAVEGSDSFDAISRSFSYLYARPWRLAFYTIVAAVYGTITYVFVRYFLKLMLSLTHYFAGLGVFWHADNTRPLWPMLWSDPLTAPRLLYAPEWISLSFGQRLGTLLIMFWVYLAVSMLGAFAISFYFSANTIIYVLMRHEVDATELDDVYLEQTDEDFGAETAPIPAPTTPVTPPPEPAPPTPEGQQTPPTT